MLNLGNKLGKVRISLAALALLAGSLGVSQISGLAQKQGGNTRPAAQPPQGGESAKERAQREEDEAKYSKPAVAATSAPATSGNGAEVDGSFGRPAREGYAAPGGDAGNIKNAPQVIPDDGFITITGSTGQLDESSTALADFRNFEVGFKNTAPTTTGTIVVRYNVTAVKDAVRTAPAATNNYQLKVRFRDDDGPANGARVVLNFFRANVNSGTGAGELIGAFDSNLLPAIPTQIFRTFTGAFCPRVSDKLDFGNYVYWVEVTLTRAGPALNANFGSLQFTETETPCTPAP